VGAFLDSPCGAVKTQVPQKLRFFTKLRSESVKLRSIFPKTQVSEICKLELLPEMGTFGA